MTQLSNGPAWLARTVAIDDPGPLERYLTDAADIAWLRGEDGFVGLGVAERVEVACIEDADEWWSCFVGSIEHETELPGQWATGPIAAASFTFDPRASRAKSVVIVPRVIVGRREGASWLTTLRRPDEQHAELPAPADPPAHPGPVTNLTHAPDDAAWLRHCAGVVERMREAPALERVLLARSVEVQLAREVDPRWIVGQLRASHGSAWTFHVEGMLGATNELLLRCEGGLATSRVVAGSRLPGGGPLSCRAAEHRVAVEAVRESMRPFCHGMNVPDAPSPVVLRRLEHLCTDITGAIDPDTSALQLLGHLHPSSSTCGTPTPAALAAIAEAEGTDRGRFSGPVGWVDAVGQGEFVLSGRSMLWNAGDPHRVGLHALSSVTPDASPVGVLAVGTAKLATLLEALSRPDA